MKKKFLLFVVMMFIPMLLMAQPICDGGTCTKEVWWDDSVGTFRDCGAATCTCINAQTGTTTYTCACYSDAECGYNQKCINNKCKTCVSCSNCTSTSWGYYSTGYQTRTVKTCSCEGVCSSKKEYRCANNYYGNSSNGSSGCSPCPLSGKSAAGSSNITACYLPMGTPMSDNSGNYVCTDNSYYTD